MTSILRRTSVGLLTAIALALPVSAAVAVDADAATTKFKNCTALNKKYPHGVGKSNARDKVRGSSKPVTNFKKSTSLYNKVIKYRSGLDRDKDGIACEKR